MHGPHVASSILAPASIMLASPLLREIISKTCFEPGEIVMLTFGLTLCPPFLNISATTIKSLYEELVQLPMQTWSTFIPSSSETLHTASGLCGFAIMGSSLFKSISIISSYFASSSATSSFQSLSLFCAFKNSLVTSSLGNKEVVAPSSAPIFVIVALSGTERLFTPSPPYSITLPTPPFTVILLNSSNITSFAETHGFSFPFSFTSTTFGYVRLKGPPPIATATSSPPAPIAIMQRPPHVGVWLSEPSIVCPGTPNLSR